VSVLAEEEMLDLEPASNTICACVCVSVSVCQCVCVCVSAHLLAYINMELGPFIYFYWVI